MTTIRQTARMQPGWYPDPYANGSLRWWDGAQWTSHAAQPHGQAPIGWGAATAPGDDLADERRAARWASVAFVVLAAVTVIEYVTSAVAFHHVWQDVRDNVDRINAGEPTRNDGLGPNLILDLIAAPVLLVQLVIMFWLFRAATFARRCSLPARRRPFWAFLGFFVPIVNFWFPYQVARDCYHPANPARATAGRWWTFYLIQSAGVIPLIIVSIFTVWGAVVVALALAPVTILAAINGRRMVAEILRDHEALAR